MELKIVHHITNENHLNFLNNKISILTFFSEDCMDCLMSFPILESLAEEFHNIISFGKVDIEESKQLADFHDVQSVPTVLVYKNQQQIKRITNFNSEERLREVIDSVLND